MNFKENFVLETYILVGHIFLME